MLAAVIVIEATWELTGVHSHAGAAPGEAHRIASNAASLVCISVIAMVFVEALSGYGPNLPVQERRFRKIYVGMFGAMIVLALVWAGNSSETTIGAEWVDGIVALSAGACVVGARLAVAYRQRHPLLAPTAKKPPVKSAPAPGAMDPRLGERIRGALEDEMRFATPDFKVADLAAAVGEQEYKVSQCITGLLGYRNFNHLINARRIEHAKLMLMAPEHRETPILSIAFDCGFGSIGPFNRAFKQEVGLTPRQFRLSAAPAA